MAKMRLYLVLVAHYDVYDPGEAFDAHVRAYFDGHEVTKQRLMAGPMEQRIPGFFVYSVPPGARFGGWTYLTSGCWKATARQQHGLEFLLSASVQSLRHVRVLTMLAYYHAGPPSQRLDLGHTASIGEPWTPDSLCDCMLICPPHGYSELEICSWNNGHIRVLAALPITAAERALKIEQGIEQLQRRLRDAQVDLANPQRPSVA